MKKKWGLMGLGLSLVILVVGLFFYFNSLKKFSATFFGSFDTITEVIYYSKNQKEFDVLFDYVEKRFGELDKLFSIYNDFDENNIKTINDMAGIEPVEVSDEIISLLNYSKAQYEFSDGKLNIALGPVLSIWHEYRDKETAIPTEEELIEANKFTNIDDLIIDGNKVYLKYPQMSLDVGAIAKGFALDIIHKELEEMGYKYYSINAGGSIYATEKPKKEENFSIGIKNPDENSEETILEVVNIKNKAVSTSGDYQRYFVYKDKVYHHIIDPVTLFPASFNRSVTVVNDSSAFSDSLSTILFLTETPEEMEKYIGDSKVYIVDSGNNFFKLP